MDISMGNTALCTVATLEANSAASVYNSSVIQVGVKLFGQVGLRRIRLVCLRISDWALRKCRCSGQRQVERENSASG